MKNLTTIITESKSSFKKINVKDSINYIDKTNLKKYIDIAKPMLSEETIEIINWLIANNSTYISELSNDNDENAIVGFYNAGKPSDEKLKMLWDLINEVNSKDRILEIPTLQTKENFDKIISQQVPADYVILGLDDEKNYDKIVRRYNRLIEKIVSQWIGKSSFNHDDLKSIAYEFFMTAIHNYGKKTKRTKANDEDLLNKTFGQYAAYQIRFGILEEIKNKSHIVRIPISQQRKEKEKKGIISKNHTLSGDKVVGHNNEEGNKTLFDFLGYLDNTTSNLDDEDLNKLWKTALDELEKNFNKMTLDIFYSFFGINDHKQLMNKELADKYNCGPSRISYYINKVIIFIKTNAKMKKLFSDINDLMNECLAELDNNDNNDIYYIDNVDNANIYDYE